MGVQGPLAALEVGEQGLKSMQEMMFVCETTVFPFGSPHGSAQRLAKGRHLVCTHWLKWLIICRIVHVLLPFIAIYLSMYIICLLCCIV